MSAPTKPERIRAAARWIGAAPFRLITGALEIIVSPRGLCLLFLGAALAFTVGGWLRPPLSPDIRGTHLPLGIWETETSAPELLMAPRQFVWASVAMPLLVIIGLAVPCVLWRPGSVQTVAGLLLAVGLGCSAAAMFNHPAVLELLDGEMEQRAGVRTIMSTYSEHLLSAASGPRVEEFDDRLIISEDFESPDPVDFSGDPWRGGTYALYGPWLCCFSAFAVLFLSKGTIWQRSARAAVWTTAGLILAGAVCSRRIYAEYLWAKAERHYRQQEFEGCRELVAHAVEVMPDFESLYRTWAFAGRLDYYQNRASVYSEVFRVLQLVRNGEYDHAKPQWDALVDRQGKHSLFIAEQASRTYSNVAGIYLHNGWYSSADAAFERVSAVAPWRLDALAGRLACRNQNFDPRPEAIAALISDFIPRIGDRTLRADLWTMAGDSYFQMGRMEEARECYASSQKAFLLPKFSNVAAQEGLLGM